MSRLPAWGTAPLSLVRVHGFTGSRVHGFTKPRSSEPRCRRMPMVDHPGRSEQHVSRGGFHYGRGGGLRYGSRCDGPPPFAGISIAREAMAGSESIADRLQMFHVKQQSTLLTSRCLIGRARELGGVPSCRHSAGCQIWCPLPMGNCQSTIEDNNLRWTARLPGMERQAGFDTPVIDQAPRIRRSSIPPGVRNWLWGGSWRKL
jgi:hypothetical protein